MRDLTISASILDVSIRQRRKIALIPQREKERREMGKGNDRKFESFRPFPEIRLISTNCRVQQKVQHLTVPVLFLAKRKLKDLRALQSTVLFYHDEYYRE